MQYNPAPQHTTLVPRLSASEAVNDDDEEFDKFASISGQQGSTLSPSHDRRSVADSELPLHTVPRRMSSVVSSTASSLNSSSMRRERESLIMTPAHSSFNYPSSHYVPSQTGSPTQLQHYTRNGQSDDEDSNLIVDLPRPKLFVANADVVSDSD